MSDTNDDDRFLWWDDAEPAPPRRPARAPDPYGPPAVVRPYVRAVEETRPDVPLQPAETGPPGLLIANDEPQTAPTTAAPGQSLGQLARAKYLADRARRRRNGIPPAEALGWSRYGRPVRSAETPWFSWLMLAGLLTVIIVVAVTAGLPDDGPPQQASPGRAQPPVVDNTGQPLPSPPTTSPLPSGPDRQAAPSTSATRHRPTPPTRPAPRPTASPSRIVLPPTSYEAESAVNRLRSGARVDGHPAASGQLMVYAIGAGNLGTLEFRGLAAPAAGTYRVRIFYQNPDDTTRTAYVRTNGGPYVLVRFDPTGPCCISTRTIPVRLVAGSGNTILFSNPDTRAPDIDRVELSGPTG